MRACSPPTVSIPLGKCTRNGWSLCYQQRLPPLNSMNSPLQQGVEEPEASHATPPRLLLAKQCSIGSPKLSHRAWTQERRARSGEVAHPAARVQSRLKKLRMGASRLRATSGHRGKQALKFPRSRHHELFSYSGVKVTLLWTISVRDRMRQYQPPGYKSRSRKYQAHQRACVTDISAPQEPEVTIVSVQG